MQTVVWGHPYDEVPVGKESVAAFRERLAPAREAGIRDYFAFVAIYNNMYFKNPLVSMQQGTAYTSRPRELLGPLVEAAHSLDMRVHPILGLTSLNLMIPAPGERVFVSITGKIQQHGVGLCPAWPENIDDSLTVCRTLIKEYGIDGLHLDSIRYEHGKGVIKKGDQPIINLCMCARCQERRLGWLGVRKPLPEHLYDPGYIYLEAKMRCALVAGFVDKLHALTKQAGIPLSAAVRANYIDDAVPLGQDWAQWARDGLLDWVCPMSYVPHAMGPFKHFVADHARLTKGTPVKYFSGIGRKCGAGTMKTDMMIKQIRHAMDHGADGVVLFHFNALGAKDFKELSKLKIG